MYVSNFCDPIFEFIIVVANPGGATARPSVVRIGPLAPGLLRLRSRQEAPAERLAYAPPSDRHAQVSDAIDNTCFIPPRSPPSFALAAWSMIVRETSFCGSNYPDSGNIFLA